MQLFFLFLVAICSIFSVKADELTCPNSPVTGDGKFPSGGLTKFPANYGCAFEFKIPRGKIVKFIVQTDATAKGDQVKIVDSVGTLYEMDGPESLLYAAADNAKISINTTTNTASFFVMWQYIDVTTYAKIQYPTGSILSLNFRQNTSYQFTSFKSRVAFHTATLDKTFDLSLSQIYVYDGEDLTGNFMGTLMDFQNTKNLSASTGNSLTLVNFYGTYAKSFGIANDYSAVFGYDSYALTLLSGSYTNIVENRMVPNMLESAVTYYCINCEEAYITYLNMADQRNGLQTVHFKPQTPTHVNNNLLVYVQGDTDQRMPQQILTNTFTMVMYQCDLHISLTPGPLYIWTLADIGRKGSIISPSLWNPTTAVAAPYSTTITTQERVKFVFNLQSVVIDKTGDKIRIEVGSSGVKPVFVEFNTTSQNTGIKAAYGTYMATSFTGTTNLASFIMTFEVEVNATTTTTTTTTTTIPVETTTKSSMMLFNFSLLTLLVARLF